MLYTGKNWQPHDFSWPSFQTEPAGLVLEHYNLPTRVEWNGSVQCVENAPTTLDKSDK